LAPVDVVGDVYRRKCPAIMEPMAEGYDYYLEGDSLIPVLAGREWKIEYTTTAETNTELAEAVKYQAGHFTLSGMIRRRRHGIVKRWQLWMLIKWGTINMASNTINMDVTVKKTLAYYLFVFACKYLKSKSIAMLILKLKLFNITLSNPKK
jgi:hypothetical protein